MIKLDYIPRNIYFERIRPFIGTQMSKVIVGQRRVGKSFLLYQLMDEIGKMFPKADMLYINKELYEFDAIKNYADWVDYVKNKRCNKKEKCFLFIDEIQDISEFERALRSFFAAGGCDIYCTGSNANLLSGESASYLSGRYVEFKVFGLCYAEFLQFHNLTDNANTTRHCGLDPQSHQERKSAA
ncbi:MAG: AAA family ATPase [Dysgonamonadaceae bacterium]|jgi:predicted AAA+ superfamily ATPase|nr:AAA family ATPase [Dysgonamonadaceae bacterium]